jgi:hypothetical protein
VSFLKLWHDCFASLGNGRRWIRSWFFDADLDDISRVGAVINRS